VRFCFLIYLLRTVCVRFIVAITYTPNTGFWFSFQYCTYNVFVRGLYFFHLRQRIRGVGTYCHEVRCHCLRRVLWFNVTKHEDRFDRPKKIDVVCCGVFLPSSLSSLLAKAADSSGGGARNSGNIKKLRDGYSNQKRTMGLSKFCTRLLHGKQVPVEDKNQFDQQCLHNLKHNPETDEAKSARRKLFQEIANDEKLFRSFQSELRRREVERHHIMFTHASVTLAIHDTEVLGHLGELALQRRSSIVMAKQLLQDEEQSQASNDTIISSSKAKRQQVRRRPVQLFSKIAAQCTTSTGQNSKRQQTNSEFEPSSMEVPDEEQHYQEQGEHFFTPPTWAPIGKRTVAAQTTRKYALVQKITAEETWNAGDSVRYRRWRLLRVFDGKKHNSNKRELPGEVGDATM
jgi:hypothetical protein